MDQNSGFAVKPNDDDIPSADMDDHHERGSDTIGRQESCFSLILLANV